MNPEQALSMLDQAVATLPLSRQDHERLAKASQIVHGALQTPTPEAVDALKMLDQASSLMTLQRADHEKSLGAVQILQKHIDKE